MSTLPVPVASNFRCQLLLTAHRRPAPHHWRGTARVGVSSLLLHLPPRHCPDMHCHQHCGPLPLQPESSLLLVLTSRWKLPLLFLPSLGILRDRSSAAGENLLLQPSLQHCTRPVRHAPVFVAGSEPSSPFSAAALRRVLHSSRALLCLSRTALPAASQWTTSSTLIP